MPSRIVKNCLPERGETISALQGVRDFAAAQNLLSRNEEDQFVPAEVRDVASDCPAFGVTAYLPLGAFDKHGCKYKDIPKYDMITVAVRNGDWATLCVSAPTQAAAAMAGDRLVDLMNVYKQVLADRRPRGRHLEAVKHLLSHLRNPAVVELPDGSQQLASRGQLMSRQLSQMETSLVSELMQYAWMAAEGMAIQPSLVVTLSVKYGVPMPAEMRAELDARENKAVQQWMKQTEKDPRSHPELT